MTQMGIPASIGFAATAGENTLHLRPQTGGHNCKIDWGDGTVTRAPVDGGNVIHSYAAAGTYNIQIKGKSFAGFYVNNQVGKEKYIAAYSMGQWAADTMTTCASSFYGCSKLATIGADLFKYTTAVTEFSGCFSNCGSVTTIPLDLFRYNTAVTDFSYCLAACTNLTTIPADLFRYNTAVTNFSYCFNRCTENLTTIPADLFRYNIAVTNFNSCFAFCANLTTIPADLFRYNTAVTNFDSCFSNCTNLTLRADIFGTDYANRFNGKNVYFPYCFSRPSFTGIQGTAPALWSFTGQNGFKAYCFAGEGNNASSISNYSSIPAIWK